MTMIPLIHLSHMDLGTVGEVYSECNIGEIKPLGSIVDDMLSMLRDLAEDMRSNPPGVVNDYEVDTLVAYAADFKKVQTAIHDGYTHVYIDPAPVRYPPDFDGDLEFIDSVLGSFGDEEDDGLPF